MKVAYCMISSICHSGKGKTTETAKRSLVTTVGGRETGMSKWGIKDF